MGQTVGQILGQVRQTQSLPRFLWATVSAVSSDGATATVELQPSGATTDAQVPADVTVSAGTLVVVLVAPIGNIVLASMRTALQTGKAES